MFPVDRGESVGAHVARAVDIIDRSELPYQVSAMGTTIEGEWDAVMVVMKQCFLAMRVDSDRIVTDVKIDYCSDASGRLKDKVDSVAKRVGRLISS